MLHIQPRWLSEQQKTAVITTLRRVKPKMVVVMDDYGFAQYVKQFVPNVIFRSWDAGDRDNSWHDIGVDDWFMSHGYYAGDMILYADNEPGWNADSINWLTAIALGCISRNWKVCLGNWSRGVPNDWGIASSLIKLCANHRQNCILGVHEYWDRAWDNDKYDQIGRYTRLIHWCDTHGMGHPLLAVTEHGQALNDNYGLVKLYQDKGASYIADQNRAAWDTFYKNDPDILGVANFAASGSAWEQTDILHCGDLLDRFDFYGEKSMIVPGMNLVSNVQIVRAGGGSVNVRSTPGTNGALIGSVKSGQVVDMYVDSKATADDYEWKRLGNNGWIAMLPDLHWSSVSDLKSRLEDMKQELVDIINSL